MHRWPRSATIGDVGRRPSATERSRIETVTSLLDAYSLTDDSLKSALEATRVLLDSPIGVLYRLKPRGDADDLEVETWLSTPHLDRAKELFDGFLLGKAVPSSYGNHNPVRPESNQRNRVLASADFREVTGERTTLEKELYPKMHARDFDTLRVLVCEGPSLLGWVGVMQPDAATTRQRRLLGAVVPAYHRRLRFERWIAEAQLASAALAPALEGIPGSAWVVDAQNRIAHANAAGKARLDTERREAVERIAAVAAGAEDPAMRAMPFTTGAGKRGVVIVEQVAARSRGGALALAARIGLTPAQTRVLCLLADGLSNATMAARLGVADRTIETHLTAIFDRAQVPSRAALLALVIDSAQ